MRNRRAPFSFELEITARCNNNCRHCYINLPTNDRAAQAQELTLPEISRIADEAVALGVVWCLITGGEPLLREDFADVYMALKRKGLLVSIFTNATPVHPAHVQLFKRFPPRDIEVTVYGVTPETYEAVTRRPGSFAAFTRGLDRLFESGVQVRLKAMALRANLHELAEIARFCRARTKDFYRFDPQLHLRFDGDPARNAEIRAERLSPEDVVALEQSDAQRFQALEDGCDKLIVAGCAHHGCDHLFHCGAGEGSFTVSYDGKFRLCSSLWAPGMTYDLHSGALRQAWEELVPRVRELRSQRQEFLERCRRCSIINLCLWCPAHAYLETGAMDSWVDYFCRVAHARARALGYHSPD
jgi:radical SAM protein with 4Fe4S-binding SPASM domain